MRKPNLNRIVAALRELTPSRLKAVSTEVAALEARSGATAVVEGRFAAGASCPHCRCQRVYRHGQANGLQRYRCRECLRTFNALSGTPLSGLHKREKWSGQAAALQDGRTLRTVAKNLGTAHRWRHRFLALPQALQPEALVGIAEADETVPAVVQGAAYAAAEGPQTRRQGRQAPSLPRAGSRSGRSRSFRRHGGLRAQGDRCDDDGRRLEAFRVGRRGAVYRWQ